MGTESGNHGVQLLPITAAHEGQRIDNFLLARLKGVPKSRIYRIIRKGEVRINKKRVKPEYKLKEADLLRIPPVRVAVKGEQPPPSKQLQSLLKHSILFEDQYMLVLNKPSGIAVHAGTGVKIGLIEALRYMFPDQTQLELVHRLDKGTSGCIMIAKDRSTLRILNQALKDGKMTKVYHALVEGHWPSSLKKVDAPLYKHQPRSGERFVEISRQGKSALTRFKSLQSFTRHTLLEAIPVTGRTHQIRVHAQSANHPVCGDDKYNSSENNTLLIRQGVSRLCLHARNLTLPHPHDSEPLTLTAEYDSQFKLAIKLLNSL